MERSFASLEESALYSEELEIVLSGGDDTEYFKWFLAAQLFGGRISEVIARHTYQAFAAHKLLTPKDILKAGREYLVSVIMREGGYVRYDERKSTQILRNCRQLLQDYKGSLKRLHETAADAKDLERRLLEFHGIGPVTVNIFLRELRPFWPKANPAPLPIVRGRAAELGIDLNRHRPQTLAFCRIEAGLMRHRKEKPTHGVFEHGASH